MLPALRASVRDAPLAGQSQTVCAPEGASLEDLVGLAFPDVILRRFAVAFVDGVEVAPEAWATLKPRAGSFINLCIRAGDADSDAGKFLRTVLQIAVIAAAAWVGGMIGGIPGALAQAGVAILGNLAINALIPITPVKARGETPSPFYTVTGARNVARLFGPAPLVLGKHRFFPPLYGQYVQETVGNDVYLRVPFCLGPAPMQVSDLKIGDTLLSSYTGVEIEQRLNASDPAHSLYTGDPQQDTVGATITTTYTVRNSVADADEIDIVIAFSGGLGGYDSKNRKVERTVTFDVRYRPAGSTEAWQTLRPIVSRANQAAINAGASSRAGYFGVRSTLAEYAAELVAFGDVDFTSYPVTRADPGRGFQETIRLVVPRNSAGYEVGVRRNAAASTDPSVVDGATWAIIGSRKTYVNPFPEAGLASIVLRIKASEQLSGVIDTFNCIAEPKIPLFSSAAKTTPSGASAASLTTVGVSRNPAEIVLNLYRGPHTSRPRSDDRIDWPAWAAFAAFCETEGLHYDEVIESAIARGELARRICAAAFARPIRWGGKLSVVIDRDRGSEAPAQVFTPRNVANLRWRKSFPADTHAVRIAFNNAANGYQADETTLYLDGFDASNATKIETLPVAGKTDADEVRVVGRQYVNNSLRQTETFTFDMDAEALTCRPGAYAVLLHDAIGVGLGSARVKSLVMSGANVAGFILDVGVATDVADTLAARWRKEDGAGGFTVATEAGVSRDATDPAKFTFPSPVTTANAPGVDDPVLIGRSTEVSLPVLVRDVSWDFGQRASLLVVPYAPERFVPDGTPLPPHTPMVTLPIAARPATPTSLGAVATAREIALSFFYAGSPRGVTLVGFETAVRETGNTADSWQDRGPLPAAARVFVAPPGNPGYSYDLRVVAVGQDSGGLPVKSDPLIVTGVAAATVPPSPTGCAAAFATRTSSGGASQVILSALWTLNEDPDVLDTVIEWRTATGPDVWKEIGRARAALGALEIHGLQVGRTYDLRFLHLSRRGIASTPTTIATITAPDTLAATGASSVPWTGVTTRPANLAALAGSEAIQNSLVAMGANSIIDSGFRTPSLHWSLAGFLNTPSVAYLAESQIRKARITGAASTPATGTAQVSGALQNSVPCVSGDRIEASAYFGAAASGWGSGQLYVDWYTSAGVYISSSFVGSNVMTGLAGTGDLSTFARVAGFATAPATTGIARLTLRFVNTSGGALTSPVGTTCLPLLRRADATQTAASPWTPGLDAVPGADITSANTAAAITGQGDLATANRASLPFGVNGLVDTNFGWQSTYWAKDSVTGTTAFTTATSTGGLKKGGITGSGLTVNGTNYIRHHSNIQDAYFPCKPGDVVGARALIGTANASSIQLLIAFRDAAGTATGFTAATVLSTGLLAGGGEETTFNELINVGTAPAGTVTANIDIRAIASTAAPVLVIAKPMLALMQSGQTAVPAYSPGREHQIGADVTLSNTAAGFTGQGALATLNLVTGGKIDIADPTNLCLDVNFDDASLWVFTGGWALDTSADVTGTLKAKRGIKITASGANPQTQGNAIYRNAPIYAVEPGVPYRLKVNVLVKAGFKGMISIVENWNDQAGTFISGSGVQGVDYRTTPAAADTLTMLTGIVVAPANAAFGCFYIACAWPAAAASAGVALAAMPRVTRATSSDMLTAGIGDNALFDTEFRYITNSWRSVAQSGTVTPAVNTSTGGLRRYTLTGAGVTIGNYLSLDSVPQWNSFPVQAGEWVEASAYVGGSNLTKTQLFVDFRDAAGANTGFSSFPEDPSVTTGSGELSTFERLFVIAQAPAGTVKAYINIRGVASTASPVLQVTKPMLARAIASQTEATLWSPGFDGEAGANITEARTAAGIVGQGGLATANFVTIGTNLRLAGGATVATTGDVVTASGTAAGIAGQGNLATANYYYQSSDPGAVAAGSLWGDSTNKILKIRDAGAWKNVGFFGDFTVALSANYSTTHSASGTMTQNVTATPSGGIGPFTYFWSVGDLYYGSKPTLTNNTTATVTVTKTFSALLSISGVINCLITDTATGRSVVRSWGYEDLATGSGDTSGGLPP